ncbi:hypothetical protein Patl1_32344 [Pistacia atlantica]|uniref:Uncharacterized protein n=1 Tax=Pistacia atlantica TaxID=434234 RepID=A0ACC1AN67_9ROSI|nr:hypothetical protein Patl1_32344 [Pistacia atlantica]
MQNSFCLMLAQAKYQTLRLQINKAKEIQLQFNKLHQNPRIQTGKMSQPLDPKETFIQKTTFKA